MNTGLDRIRKLYSEAGGNSLKAAQLHQELALAPENDPVWTAYRAASEALQAKNAWNPFEKLMRIQEAQRIFAKAVEAAPENVEIRFLRFSIQANTPALLGLSQEIRADKQKILANLAEAELPEKMRPAIADYLIQSGVCQPPEIAFLKTLLD
ncbi:MAG: hypothetical protein OHK0053_33650 [Microscillaceae bacterium]